uniref:UBC core domain-containing protein n=1 Tax=Mucochytrium quahogii TaxID=96639 RepID=A0A7S2SCM5_9STRA|mmetsp:Transcript_2899/g.4160  ORF Transcript_2899/g.4160 Transcript_2899/m.4160 type:complete len:222 (-) Transcript_2899:45-710(-)|eukprot:CAMPEP_0203748114 /NCGR_PEP_ID=MMETSP0098-20131031/3073_1 /ASSEMBLY_ACC=CAM_ASM_000208 /TAXON_ID=96639 /ORGANISM=" , Strain NY0313808BC1" /LENGTH=221 /DNA_ID=CAMNT_0050636739 /DNA_START=815 /DNA_END=1480 /DNA_ORIENTATION=+
MASSMGTSHSSAGLLLAREFSGLKKRPTCKYFVVYDMVNENIFEWVIYVIGPPGTFYDGGCYRAIMRFPVDYPMSPPSVQFTSKVMHPNVYRDGKVCITTLQIMSSDARETESVLFWRPVLGVEQAVISVVSLLSDPNVDDPANTDAAKCLAETPLRFKEICAKHAKASLAALPKDFEYPQLEERRATEDSVENKKNDTHCSFDDDDEEEYVYSDDEYTSM